MSTDQHQHNWQEDGVRVIRPEQFDANTPQTRGMQRVAAVSKQLAGSKGIWAGVTTVEKSATTAKHHHGDQETVIYVKSGNIKMRWGNDLEFEENAGAGDFVYVPPFVPHQEINGGNEQSIWIIVRTGQEPIVVNLEAVNDAQQKVDDHLHGF
ncbi:MAG TPA: cupin domain-containing protein [Dictyobacter sp.]|jgi:uncharacterized RmlC-like cupin family protein|nr:cupin domain-containing protein [Dictyobacter sp.]